MRLPTPGSVPAPQPQRLPRNNINVKNTQGCIVWRITEPQGVPVKDRHFCLHHLEAAAIMECGDGFYRGRKRLALRVLRALVAPPKALESFGKMSDWLCPARLSIFSSN
jgi:hypothetical protein